MHTQWNRLKNAIFYSWCSVKNRDPLSKIDPKLQIRSFLPQLNSPINSEASPSRILSHLFWKQLSWDQIVKQIGEIYVFDTGCGSGNYGSLLETFSQGHVKRYKGIDVYEHANWKNLRLNPNRMVEKYSGKNIVSYIPIDTNFFMSQSAIEHFQNDKRYFEDIRTFAELQKRPTIQVHLFPSAACMKLYGRHGYRQYTPRTISRLTRLFPNAQCLLFGLGGPACNRVHEEFITKPLQSERVDYRKTKPDEYRQALQSAIKEDEANPNALDNPSFWALVICSNWKKPFVL